VPEVNTLQPLNIPLNSFGPAVPSGIVPPFGSTPWNTLSRKASLQNCSSNCTSGLFGGTTTFSAHLVPDSFVSGRVIASQTIVQPLIFTCFSSNIGMVYFLLNARAPMVSVASISFNPPEGRRVTVFNTCSNCCLNSRGTLAFACVGVSTSFLAISP